MPKPTPPKAASINRSLSKRSIAIAGHRTSIALEPEFWDALDALARARAMTLAHLIAEIDSARADERPDRPLASALRVYALQKALTA